MSNSVLTDTNAPNSSLEVTGSCQIPNQWRHGNKKLVLQDYFEEWKNFTKDKLSASQSSKKRKPTQTKVNQHSLSSWNFIDLNKILLQNEVDTLRKYWHTWKQIVKNNKNFSKKNRIANGFKKNQIENLSFPVHCSPADGSHNNDSTKRHKNSCWKNTSSHLVRKSIMRPKTKNIGGNQEHILQTSDSECYSDLKCCTEDNDDTGILSTWRAVKNNSTTAKAQDMSMSKIETFLTAVKAAKVKKAKKLKSNHSIVHRLHPKREKSPNIEYLNINHHTGEAQELNSFRMQTNQSHKDVMNKLADSRDIESRKAISSIKDEVNASLTEAQNLLKSTMEASYRGNCTSRKILKHPNRKEIPLPPEMPVSDIVERMKMRELERAARWQQSRERKQRTESERTKKLAEEEREKARQQELSKKLKHLELREKKIEKMLREKHLEEVRERYHHLNLKALKHYDENLLHKGLLSFVNELKMKATLELQAHSHYKKMLTCKIFLDWKNFAQLSSKNRMFSAQEFHKKQLLKKYLKNWCMLQREYILNKQAAIDLYDMRTQERAFVRWNQYTCDMMIELNCKCEVADKFYNRCLLRKSIKCWRSLPAVMESERARERIKNSFRMKVLEIFPDFSPQLDDDG